MESNLPKEPALSPRMSIIERRLWLASHKAPEGMLLVDIMEMERMRQVVTAQQERLEADHAILQRLVNVVEAALAIEDPAAAKKYLYDETHKD